MVKKPADHELRYFTHEDFMKSVDSLTDQIIKDGYEFDGIYAVPRGGLKLGLYLSHRLDLEMVRKPNAYSLVVDEIADSGGTLANLGAYSKIATIHYKPQSLIKPDYFYEKIPNKQWIKYDWEMD
jgi:hypoxanthine phosphoribosyltransferase